MRRTQPITKKAKISATTHVQLLQWLHGKQQQQQSCNSDGMLPERQEQVDRWILTEYGAPTGSSSVLKTSF